MIVVRTIRVSLFVYVKEQATSHRLYRERVDESRLVDLLQDVSVPTLSPSSSVKHSRGQWGRAREEIATRERYGLRGELAA